MTQGSSKVRVRWELDSVWPFDLDTTALLAILACLFYGYLLGYLVGSGQL